MASIPDSTPPKGPRLVSGTPEEPAAGTGSGHLEGLGTGDVPEGVDIRQAAGDPAATGPDPIKPGDSYSSGSVEDELTERRDAILLGMLPDVAFDGWTRTAMIRGAESAGYEAPDALAAFPDGPAQVIGHFSRWADRAMLERLDTMDLPALKVRERITAAVRVRLEILAPWKEAVRRSIAVLALPQNAALGPTLLFRTVDAMWYAAGDTATDFNYYTKRALLAGVQTSTVLYWLDDRSDGNADTLAFLDRRIGDVMTLGKGLSGAKGMTDLLTRLPNPLRFARHLRRTAR